ncbi:hypothetical protein VPMS16_108 [Vibrio sp. 16]|nr:hypothetical protein VPMS16_108 [Vibrio sp. 16]
MTLLYAGEFIVVPQSTDIEDKHDENSIHQRRNAGFGLHGEHLLLNQAEHSSLNAEHETLRITLKHLLTRST